MPPGDLLFGNAPALARDPLGTLVEWMLERGDVVRLRLGAACAHVVFHPEHVRRVLSTEHRAYSKKTRGYATLSLFMGSGLLTSDGELWRRQRRIVQPAFHRDRILAFAPRMTRAAEDMLERWAPLAARGEPFDVAAEMMRLTLRIVSECLFGLDLSAESADARAAIQFIQEDANRRITGVWDVPFSWPTARNRRLRAARATLDRILARVIAERRPGEDRGDLLSMLIDSRDADSDGRMSESQLRDELVTMFLAGHESTANALSWVFFLLSRHPEVARELTAELARELGGRAPTTADLPRLPYCQAVIKETMRLYPPAWSMGRAPIDDDVIAGFSIPRGSLVILAPWATHRHPGFWTNPEGFDPSRFLRTEPDRYAYFPFGGGPRLCIGMGFALLEAELVLATIAQRYRLDLVPGQTVEPEPQITLRPRRGVRVTAHAVEH